MIEKSQELECDQIIFDLEDSVAPSEKDSAREKILEFFSSRASRSRAHLSLRINDPASAFFEKDLALLEKIDSNQLFSIVLPKVNHASDLERVNLNVAIDAQIESAKGLVNVEEIAAHSRCASLAFGPLDFSADLGISASATSTRESEFLLYPLMKILVAARASGKLAFDGPEVNIADSERFVTRTEYVRDMGFDGKWVIHPSQISPCNSIFTPNQSELERAKELIAKYEAALAEGIGATTQGNFMIDEASRKQALKVLARAEAFGVR
jgi:citrate lyase subunit beta/citryl-CoA lyase